MPNVIRSTDFKLNTGKCLDEFYAGTENYMVIANESYFKKTYIVVKPDSYMQTLAKAGDLDSVTTISKVLSLIKEKISQKYRDIRATAR